MLLHYVFALEGNLYDTFPLQLKMKFDANGPPVEVGTFKIRNIETPIGSQFDDEIWRALADPKGFAERGGGEGADEGEPEVGIEDVEMLHSVLKAQRARMPPLPSDKECNASVFVRFIKFYLKGQQELVTDAIDTLSEMMGGAYGEEGEEFEECEAEEENEDDFIEPKEDNFIEPEEHVVALPPAPLSPARQAPPTPQPVEAKATAAVDYKLPDPRLMSPEEKEVLVQKLREQKEEDERSLLQTIVQLKRKFGDE